MPTVPLTSLIQTLHTKFPNLKGYDETRLFSVLMEAGFDVEFGIDNEGSTTVTHADITAEVEERLKKV
jgi:hypothetical protein